MFILEQQLYTYTVWVQYMANKKGFATVIKHCPLVGKMKYTVCWVSLLKLKWNQTLG